MSNDVITHSGEELIDQEVMAREWDRFKEVFGGSQGDAVHGMLIYRAIAAYVQSAFELGPIEVEYADNE